MLTLGKAGAPGLTRSGKLDTAGRLPFSPHASTLYTIYLDSFNFLPAKGVVQVNQD
jgi:hypothetical protein